MVSHRFADCDLFISGLNRVKRRNHAIFCRSVFIIDSNMRLQRIQLLNCICFQLLSAYNNMLDINEVLCVHLFDHRFQKTGRS